MKKSRGSTFRNNKQRVKTAQGRKISSTQWLKRHLNDPYVQLAKAKGYRSRAAFKLQEILEKFPELKKFKTVVDLGCAPGGWLQIIKQEMPAAKLIGVDLKVVEEVEGAFLIQGDFLLPDTGELLHAALEGAKVELLLSDMAANSSGDSDVDHVRNVELIEVALEFALQHLQTGGAFVCKVLQGRQQEVLLMRIKTLFNKVKHFKPPTSYADSTEIFMVAQGFRIKS
jgi:23S rRNA (uridine2552-2'-O)-methyltransferase